MVSSEFYELFAKVFAFKQPDKCLGSILQALRDALAVLDLAAGDPADELGQRFRPQLHAVGDDEALHLDAVGEDRGEIFHAIGLGGVVLRDQAAYRDARKGVHALERRIEDFAADVLEVDRKRARLNSSDS